MELYGPVDISLLMLFGATSKEYDECLPVPCQIDPISRPPINLQFTDTCKPFDIGSITHLKPQGSSRYLGRSLSVEPIEPALKSVRAILTDAFLRTNLYDLISNILVTIKQIFCLPVILLRAWSLVVFGG